MNSKLQHNRCHSIFVIQVDLNEKRVLVASPNLTERTKCRRPITKPVYTKQSRSLERVSGKVEGADLFHKPGLSEAEKKDLVEYLKSL